MDKQTNKKNIILFYMSTKNPNSESKPWTYREVDDTITINDCVSQLEPVSRLILEREPNVDTEIVMICSQKTAEEGNGRDFFIERIQTKFPDDNVVINNTIETDRRNIIIQTIDSDDNDPLEDVKQAIEKVKQIYQENDECSFYVAANGGFRDNSTILVVIVNLLQFEGISVENIYTTKDDSCKIVDFRAGQLVDYSSAINDLIEFGSVDDLENYFIKKGLDVSDDSIINSLRTISESIQMCNVELYEKGMREVYDAFNNEEVKNNSIIAKQTEFEILENIFKTDLKIIEKSSFSYIDMLRRCVDKKMYSQALAIIESKMPEEYFKYGIAYSEPTEELFKFFYDVKQSATNDRDFSYPVDIINKFVKEYSNQFSKEKDYLEEIIDQITKIKNRAFEMIENKDINKSRIVDQEEDVMRKFTNCNGGFLNSRNINTKLTSDTIYRTLFEIVIRLHSVLKKERNNIFHGNERVQLEYKYLIAFIKLYTDISEKIIDYAKNNGYNPGCDLKQVNIDYYAKVKEIYKEHLENKKKRKANKCHASNA